MKPLRTTAFAFFLTGLALTASFEAAAKPSREAEMNYAMQAVERGDFEAAEAILAPYMVRHENGELRFKSFGGFSGRKTAIDAVVMLLWETGRDRTLESFAKRYLNGYERNVTLCRIAERGAEYEAAFKCWNDVGDVDRARRVIKTKLALEVMTP